MRTLQRDGRRREEERVRASVAVILVGLSPRGRGLRTANDSLRFLGRSGDLEQVEHPGV